MCSTILLVALSTVSGHKCNGCAVVVDCNGACHGCAVVACDGCYGGCACHRAHKCGLFKRLFAKKCHCACDCGGCNGCFRKHRCCRPACCEAVCHGCEAPACNGCAAPEGAAPEGSTEPTPPAPMGEQPQTESGFKVDRSIVAVSFQAERAEFSDEPVVVFARN